MSTYSISEIFHRLQRNVHPPLHYIILKEWIRVFGDSEVALRGLSLGFAILLLPVLMWSARLVLSQSFYHVQDRVNSNGALYSWYLVLPAMLATIHFQLVAAGSTGRMYAIGCFLAGLSSCLLLEALQCNARFFFWWLSYGISMAAFCYTHYFAFYTLLAHVLYVALYCTLKWRLVSPESAVRSAEGFVYAGAVLVVLFLPWLSTLVRQAVDVHESWWVPSLTLQTVEESLFAWITGMKYEDPMEARIWLGMLGCIIIWTLIRGGLPAWFFFVQAFVPWIAMVTTSYFGGQSLLQPRYFDFALIGLFGLWSVTWRLLPSAPARVMFMLIIGCPLVVGLVAYLDKMPCDDPPYARAAEWLRHECNESDLLLVDDFREISRLRYYFSRFDLPWLDLRACDYAGARRGHVVHVAALTELELSWRNNDILPADEKRRIWYLSKGGGSPCFSIIDRKRSSSIVFSDGGEDDISLILYEPAPEGRK